MPFGLPFVYLVDTLPLIYPFNGCLAAIPDALKPMYNLTEFDRLPRVKKGVGEAGEVPQRSCSS